MGKLIYLIFYAVFFVVGFYLMVKRTRELRAPRQYKDASFSWAEPHRSDLEDDVPTWTAINTHRLASILLGLVTLLILLTRPSEAFTLDFLPPPFAWLSDSMLVGFAALNGYFLGYVLGGPVAEVVAGDHHYALSAAGILASGYLFPWDTFSHITMDDLRGGVHLWSASMPGTAAFVFRPPSAEESRALFADLRDHLPQGEPPADFASKFGFALRMALLCAPFVLVGILLYLTPAGVSLLALCALLFVLLPVGGSFIMRSVYGGKARPIAASR